jgi:diacylglycerol kinase family enzyme
MKPKIVFVGTGANFSMIAFDLAEAEQAVALARRVAEHSGRTVIVRGADGEILDTIEAAARN